MKILHLYADWKWTGPSEPVFNLCQGLTRAGQVVYVGCFEPPVDFKGQTLLGHLHNFQVKSVSLKRPGKLTGLFALIQNINRLEKFLSEELIDLIHTHSSLDHFYAAKAIRHLHNKPKIIRTNHKGIPLPPDFIASYLIKHTDGYITLSESLLKTDRETFGLAPERNWWVEGAIDLERFNPQKISRNLRPGLGLTEEDIVIGVVARIQRHRRFEILLRAFQEACKENPRLKLVVVGRGTYQNEILLEPVKMMGLSKQVIYAGYRTEDYTEILATFDFGIFLVPGSDGSCRAAREMMAMGKPLIVARRGILPELIQNEVDGLVIDDTVTNLVSAMLRLGKDKDLRTRLGTAARRIALERFDLNQQVNQTLQIYEQALR